MIWTTEDDIAGSSGLLRLEAYARDMGVSSGYTDLGCRWHNRLRSSVSNANSPKQSRDVAGIPAAGVRLPAFGAKKRPSAIVPIARSCALFQRAIS